MKQASAIAAVVVALCGGCASPVVRHSVVNGIAIVEHIDMLDSPCGNRGPAAGCYWVTPRRVADGQFVTVHHISYSSVAPAYVRVHELAHAQGMRHDEWRFNSWHKETCAKITTGISGYPVGALICVDGRREIIR